MEKISEAAYEIAIGSLQMQSKRLFILCIILIVVLVGTNAGWLIHESMYADETTTVSQEVDTGEGDAIITGVGDIYGESKADSNGQN